jgi:hypothetical protein
MPESDRLLEAVYDTVNGYSEERKRIIIARAAALAAKYQSD